MNKKVLGYIIAIALILMIAGCTTIENSYNKIRGRNVTTRATLINNSYPVCECGTGECGTEFDAAIYYFNDEIISGFSRYIDESNEYLYCIITRLDNEDISNQLIMKDSEIRLSIRFDRDSTMRCEPACIPRAGTTYNDMYAENLDIGIIENAKSTWCTSDAGVFITSKVFTNQEGQDYALYIRSLELEDIYKTHYEEVIA